MAKRLTGGALGALLLATVGCGGGSRESMLKETTRLLNEMSGVVEKAANAAEAKPKLEAANARLKDLQKRLAALGQPSEKEGEELSKHIEPELQKAKVRFFAATLQLRKKDPAGVEEIEPLLKGLEQ